jgi:broad specificity phosphatase PhoE
LHRQHNIRHRNAFGAIKQPFAFAIGFPSSSSNRHGHSLANEQETIISRPEEGVKLEWGLSQLGRQQATSAGERLKRCLTDSAWGIDPSLLAIYTSPFSRTLQTAALVGSHLGVEPSDPLRFFVSEALRERDFGEYEGSSTVNYAKVWAEDALGTHRRPPGGGESVDDVAARLQRFVERIEDAFGHQHQHQRHEANERGETSQKMDIVLVSHGDALSILAAVLSGSDLRKHREHGLANCGLLRIP